MSPRGNVANISSINGRLRRIARRAPRQGGLLPDYLIVGAPRSGTTSVHGWLGEHPMVARTEKEILFFNSHWDRGVEWYRSQFPSVAESARFSQQHGRPFLTGDATASYLLHHWTPERAASVVPGAKLIVCLRDPVDRALSQFHAGRRRDYEPLETFEAALAAEPGRLEPETARVEADPGYFSRPLHVWAYVAGGRYAEQLERWFAHFPREAFLFVSFERDLVADPVAGLHRIQAHLGLDPHTNRELPTLNMNAGSYGQMADETRARLVEEFRAPNRRLTELTGIDFGWPT